MTTSYISSSDNWDMCHMELNELKELNKYYEGKDDMPAKSTTERQRYFLERAARLAMKSSMSHKHGCIIVKDGTIIAEGYNHHVTHMYHKFSIHAEIDAINKSRRGRNMIDTQGLEMYVVRIGSLKFNHCLKYSKPCDGCQIAIEKSGIKKVFYSTNAEYDEMWKKLHC